MKEMVVEGVVGIVEGLNPTLIRMKLMAFDQHSEQPKKAKEAKKADVKAGAPQTSAANT